MIRKSSNHNKKNKKKMTRKKYTMNGKTRFKMVINMYRSVITINVNGLNAPTKTHRMAGWIKKIRANNMLPIRGSL